MACMLVVVSACTPQMRLERIVRNHPEVLTKNYLDTSFVYQIDTFYLHAPGMDTTLIQTDTVIVHDSLGTITVYKQKEGKVRIVTQYRPMLFPVVRKSMTITRDNTLHVASAPIDKWKYRKQGIVWCLITEAILFILYILLKTYLKIV